MNLDDSQSMAQLLVGLNLAYFSFREIRSPATARRTKQQEHVRKLAVAARSAFEAIPRPERYELGDEASQVYDDAQRALFDLRLPAYNLELYGADAFSDNIDQFDKGIRFCALIAATVNVAILWLAAVDGTRSISGLAFTLISLLSAAPVAVAIWYNWMIGKMIDEGGKNLKEFETQIKRIMEDFNTQVLPRYQKLIADKKPPSAPGAARAGSGATGGN